MKDKLKSFLHAVLDPTLKLWYKINYALFNIFLRKKMLHKYYVSICTIFKDEALYLKEWIEYYRLIGIDHIFMYNNFSSDNYLDVLAPYIQEDFITLIDWPVQQGQLSAYKHCIENYSYLSNWIGFIDIDEFFVSKKHLQINEELRSFESYPVVMANWKTFGSSAIDARNISNPIIGDFTKCTEDFFWGKYFYNTSYKINFNYRKNKIYVHSLWIKIGLAYIPPVTCNYDFYFGKYIERLDKVIDRNFWLNHYFTKSKSEFEVRMKKSDVMYKKNSKNMTMLENLDKKCTGVDKTIQYYLQNLRNKMGLPVMPEK